MKAIGLPPINCTFALVDHDGRAVNEYSFVGLYLLVFFGFTHCRVVCPRTLANLSAVLDLLGPSANLVQPLYITVDPEHDTPNAMRQFLAAYPRFLGLTGSPEAVELAKQSFRIFARRQDNPDDSDGYDMPHTAFIYLIGPEGTYLAHFADANDREMVAERIAAIVSASGF